MLMFVLMLQVPVNNFSIMSGQFPVSMSWTSTWQRVIVSFSRGLTLPLAIVVICYKKFRVATNIRHWLKVQSSRWFKNYIFAKKCILIIFSNIAFIIPSQFIIVIFYSLDAGFFQYHQSVKQFGSRSGPTFCRARSGSKLFAKVNSRQQKSPLACKELNTKQLVDTISG